MKNFFLRKMVLVLGLLSTLLGGCAYKEINVNVDRPANIDMSAYPTIGVWKFKGRKGDLATSELNEALSHSKRFKVVNNRELEKILKKQGLQSTEIFDENHAIELGKVLGTSAVISGKIETYDYQ